MAAIILENVIVMKTSGGRVFKLNRVDNNVTIYANETQYQADNPIGSLPSSEFMEVISLIKGQTTSE